MKFTILTKNEFQQFYEQHPNMNFMQSIELGNLRQEQNKKIHYVGVKNNNKVVAGSLIIEERRVFKKIYFYAPRGLLIDYHNLELLDFFTTELKKYLKKIGGFRLVIDPLVIYQIRNNDGSINSNEQTDDLAILNLKKLGYKHFGFNKFLETKQVRFGCRMKVEDSYESIYQKFSKSTKRNIENSIKKGLMVRKGNQDDLKTMSYLFEETANRKHFDVFDQNYYLKMYQNMKELMTIYIAYIDTDKFYEYVLDNIRAIEMELLDIKEKIKHEKSGRKLNDKLTTKTNQLQKINQELILAKELKRNHSPRIDIAALLSVESGNEYLTLTSGSLEQYLSFTPKYLLYQEHIKDAYEKKIAYCNFYGIMGEFNKEKNPQYGVYEFKRGFNTEVVEYIGEFSLKISFHNYIYEILSKIKKATKK